MYNIQPSYQVVFAAITGLKHAQNPDKKGPTPCWFSSWWKNNKLHRITTKPLAHVQFTTAQERDVKTWFDDYKKALVSLGIKNKRNIINFDEAGF